jgi:CubicO group peptidase (beta-lactamase class C family)
MLDRPMVAEPGRKGEYCSGGMHLLSGIVSQVTHANELEYARASLFGPLGIRDAVWPSDAHGISHGWGDLHLHPHDMAKIGYLWMNEGRWRDRQIIPAGWMASAIKPHARVLDHDYGYGLWLNPDRDPFLFEANGRGGQRITVLPSQRLVLAITGGAFEPGDIAPFIWKALRSDGPLPANEAATRRLEVLLADARRPLAGDPSPPGGDVAQKVSGTRYLLAANPIDWRAITFTFPNSGTPMARLEFGDGRIEDRPIGLDGIPRISPRGRFDLPVAVQGRWTDRSTFELDYDEVANINSFVCRFAFDEAGALIGIKERSGELDIEIRATPSGK